jgi:hypothetical protein
LKLSDGILGKIGECSANNFVVVVAAIDGDVAAPAKAARGADFKRICFSGIESGRGTIAGKQISQFKKIATASPGRSKA